MSLDFKAPFGDDITFGGTSDIKDVTAGGLDFEFITGLDELTQRVVYRILTLKGEWIPFPNYGTSVRKAVHETLTADLIFKLKGEILNQIVQEVDIAPTPEPQVIFDAKPRGQLVCRVSFYTRALQLVSFAFKPRSETENG